MNIVQFGIGNIGKELVKQAMNKVRYVCLVEEDFFYYKETGFSSEELMQIIEHKKTPITGFYFNKISDIGSLNTFLINI